jgi:hypothetical protein
MWHFTCWYFILYVLFRLYVTFDTKLNWQLHITNAIFKARKALFAIRLLKRFFTNDEMRTLLDAHFYSVLYYSAVIWLTPSLSPDMKQNLLSISANALRSCLMHGGLDISFDCKPTKNVPQLKLCTTKWHLICLRSLITLTTNFPFNL